MKKIMFVMTILAAFTSICAQTAVFPSSGNGTPEDPFQISTWQNLYWLSQANGYWKSSYHFIQTADIDFADAIPAINTWNYGRGWSPIGGITMFTGTYDGNGHTISNLYAYDAESYVLGLFGETNQTTIKNLGLTSPYFRGEEPVIGSIVAIGSFTTISNCYVRGGSLINQFYLNGGIAGVLFDWSSITDSYAQCTFTGPAMHGGIIGAHYPNCSMIRCYSASVFPVSGSNRGALASQVYGGLIQDNRWDASKAGSIGAIGNQSGSPVLINNAGLSTSDMKNPVNYPASWDFEDVWGCYHAYNDGYPYLRWEDPPIPDFPQDSFTEVEEGISIKPSVDLSYSEDQLYENFPVFQSSSFVPLFYIALSGTQSNVSIEINTSAPWGACHYGGNWYAEHNNGSSIIFTGVDFSSKGDVYIVLGDTDPTLPVTLSSFTGVYTAASFVTLQWVVESETGHSGYFVLRSPDSFIQNACRINLQIIDQGVPAGSQITYTFIDNELNLGSAYYYWLESVSTNNTVEHFGPVIVKINTDPNSDVPGVNPFSTLRPAYPNPFNPMLNIPYYIDASGDIQLSIYNSRGQMVRSFCEHHAEPGSYRLIWNARDDRSKVLTSGVYLLVMKQGDRAWQQKVRLSK